MNFSCFGNRYVFISSLLVLDFRNFQSVFIGFYKVLHSLCDFLMFFGGKMPYILWIESCVLRDGFDVALDRSELVSDI